MKSVLISMFILMLSSPLVFAQEIVSIKISPPDEAFTGVIFGIPRPYHYLNGIRLHFPEDFISEDITLSIKIPRFAKVNDEKNEVSFEGEIVIAVTFEVIIDGEVVSPFNFNTPVVMTLPYKRELLEELDIDPMNLGLYYVNESGELIQEGISDIVVDPDANTITGNIAHFSDIAMVPREVQTVVEEVTQPSAFTLSQNFPNPFNPTTTIEYFLPQKGFVTLSIYNVSGQAVNVLKDEIQPAGNHSVTWSAMGIPTGLYFCTLKANGISETRKMVLVK